MAAYDAMDYDTRDVPVTQQDGVAIESMEDIRQSISRIEAILDRGHELLYGEQPPPSDAARRRSSAEAGGSSSSAAMMSSSMPPTVQRLSLDSSRRRAANAGGGGGSLSQRSGSSGQPGRRRGNGVTTITARTTTTTNSRPGSGRGPSGFNLPLPQGRTGSVRSTATGNSLFQHQTAQEEPSARHSYMRTSRTSISQLTAAAPTTRRTARTQPSVSARGRRLARASLLGHRLPNFEEGVDADDLPQNLTLQELKDRVHRELEAYRRRGPFDPLRHRLSDHSTTVTVGGVHQRGRRRVPLWQPRTVSGTVRKNDTTTTTTSTANRPRNGPASRVRATSARPTTSALSGRRVRPWSGRAQSYQSPYKQQPMAQSRPRPRWQAAQSYSSQQQQTQVQQQQSSQKERPTRRVGAWLSRLVTAGGTHGYDRRTTTNSNLSGGPAATTTTYSNNRRTQAASTSPAPRWNSGVQGQRSPPARAPHSVVHPQRFLVSRPKTRSAPNMTTTTTDNHPSTNNSHVVSRRGREGVPVWERLYKMAAAQREASLVATVAARRAAEEAAAKQRALSMQSSRRPSRCSPGASSRHRRSTVTTTSNTAATHQSQGVTANKAATSSSAVQTNNETTTITATAPSETIDGRYESCMSVTDNHSTSVAGSGLATHQAQDEASVPHFVTPLQLDALMKK